LAAAYGIVKQHAGYISAESPPGGGTVFRVYLPVHKDAEEAATSGSRDVTSPRNTATVLIVEDQPGVRELARDILEGEGYSILGADGGDQALALAERHRGAIHLLLTDIMMPHMSGPELVRNLVKVHAGLRVVYMSGFVGDALDPNVVVQPGARVLPKPFTREMLLREVRAALAY
jgi:CheY-like chemotaxis protein